MNVRSAGSAFTRVAAIVFCVGAVLIPRRVVAQEPAAGSAAPQVPAAGDSAAPTPAAPRTPPLPIVGWSDGFFIQSSNGDYRLQFGLLTQADGRFALDDVNQAVVDTFTMRRLRPSLRGRIARNFEFFFNPDVAGGTVAVQDAYVDTRFTPALVIRVGKSKTPFGIERLQAVGNLLFFERALPTALVPNRDIGIQALGDLAGGRVSYAAGILNGVPDGASADLDANDGKDVAGRIAIHPLGLPSPRPLGGLTVAFAATTGKQSGALPTLRTSTLLQSFATYTGATADGRLTRWSPQASYFYKRVAALAEYVHTQVPVRRGSARARVSHEGWQVAGLYVLTNDTATERGVRPAHNFDLGNGHLGAFQIGARYHTLTLDQDAFALALVTPGSSREARAWTVGLNWYLTPQIKYVFNFERTAFDDGGVSARHAEHALTVRAQLVF